MRSRSAFLATVGLLVLVLAGWMAMDKGFSPAVATTEGDKTSAAVTGPNEHAKKYRVVFEITDPAGINDPAGQGYAKWKTVLNNVNNSLNEIGEDNMQVEVVVHSDAIPLLNKNESPKELQDTIKKLQDRGVVFAACANAMKSRGYTMDDMLPGVVQVPAGVAEVIRKQQEGWIYMHP